MELIRERELGIAGERYGSFLEAYRANDRRPLNAQVAGRGDGSSRGLVEADDGVVLAPEETRQALLYGSDLYAGRYQEMRKRVRRTLAERYEWMDEDRFGADVRGEHVIMERYAIGHPEAFHRKRSIRRRERSVAILYDAMCPASTPVAKRIEAGCIVAACADALERMGYEVALDFCLATYDGNSMSDDPTLLLEVALKGYGDALNAKRLEFPLAAKPVLFHLGVWWAHRFPGATCDFGEGEGYPVSYDARRVKALEEYARRRHGAYLSEDILEVQLGMDPTRALERILGAVGEEDALEQHMVAKTTMQASESPAQGKLFGGVRGLGERLGAGGGDGAGAYAGDAGAGEVSGNGAPGNGGEGAGDEPKGTVPFSSSGGDGVRAPGEAGRQGSNASDNPAGVAGGASTGTGMDASSAEQVPGGSRDGGDASGEPSAADGDDAPEGSSGADDACGGKAGAEGDTGDPSGVDDGRATAGSGDGDSAPSGAGNADSPGGGGAGEERPSDDEDEPESDEDDDDEQGESMNDDTSEQQEQRDREDAGQNEEQPPEDRRPDHDPDDGERERDSFIVELRKRYVRFERGDYRRAKEREMRGAHAGANATGTGGATGRGPVKAPPAAPVTGADDYEFGTPRSTPFSMNYVPKRKG